MLRWLALAHIFRKKFTQLTTRKGVCAACRTSFAVGEKKRGVRLRRTVHTYRPKIIWGGGVVFRSVFFRVFVWRLFGHFFLSISNRSSLLVVPF